MAKTKRIKFKLQKKISYFIAFIAFLISIIGSLLWPNLFEIKRGLPQEASVSKTKVHIIDVGQGDAVLLEDNGKFALVDAGEKNSQDAVVRYLKDANVKKLDYMIMSHPHSDHIGGMSEIIANFEIEKILFPQFEKASISTTSVFEKLLDNIINKNIPTAIMKSGDTFLLGEAQIDILFDGIKSDSQNNISPTILFNANGMKYLSTGDGEKALEREIIQTIKPLKVDVFKAAHHGSDTSNTQDFLKHIKPTLAVISVGDENTYGHPSQNVLSTFNKLSIETMRTDKNGTIVAYVNLENETKIITLKQ